MSFDNTDKKRRDKTTSTPRNHREWFLFYLFNDPEFIDKKEKIQASIQSLYGQDAYGLMLLLGADKGISDQLKQRSKLKKLPVAAVLQPDKPELMYDMQSPEYDIIRAIQALAEYFDVSVATIEQGLRYHPLTPSQIIDSMPTVTIDSNKILLALNANTRLADIKAIYWQVEKLQKTLPGYHARHRDKERPDLIYAIYKQRLKGIAFNEIYRLYEQGQLPGYSGTPSITGEKNLAQMYRKYKPSTL